MNAPEGQPPRSPAPPDTRQMGLVAVMLNERFNGYWIPATVKRSPEDLRPDQAELREAVRVTYLWLRSLQDGAAASGGEREITDELDKLDRLINDPSGATSFVAVRECVRRLRAALRASGEREVPLADAIDRVKRAGLVSVTETERGKHYSFEGIGPTNEERNALRQRITELEAALRASGERAGEVTAEDRAWLEGQAKQLDIAARLRAARSGHREIGPDPAKEAARYRRILAALSSRQDGQETP